MVTADYYYPDCEYLVDLFLQSGVEKLLAWAAGIEPTTLDLSSQSGAYDLSATATDVLFKSQARPIISDHHQFLLSLSKNLLEPLRHF